MRFTLNWQLPSSVALGAAVVFAFTSAAFADTAYISQAFGNSGGRVLALSTPTHLPPSTGIAAPIQTRAVLPELATPRVTGGNYASTLQIGSSNTVFQAQSGYGNISKVGIVGGDRNAVGVLQSGNSLRSNVVLLGTMGASVGVLQGNGAAPVNLLIGRLPNGALLIGGLPIRR
jgi:hypothetical protein